MRAVQASLPDRKAAPERRRAASFSRSWFVPIAVVVSIVTHLAALGLLVLLQRGPGAALKPDYQGAVELLMVEQKGAVASQKGEKAQAAPPAKAEPKVAQVAPPTHPVPPAAPKPTAAAKPAPAAPPAAPPPPLSVAGGDEPAPPEQPKPDAAEPQPKPVQAAAAPPAAPPVPVAETPAQGLVFDLNGTDSDSNAMATGAGIIPASPDDRFRNRPPPYPDDAAMRGEQGDVILTVHVAANGLTEGVVIESSSGSGSLDRAAVDAVRKWRFHPAMKDNEPVPFDFPVRFSFRP